MLHPTALSFYHCIGPRWPPHHYLALKLRMFTSNCLAHASFTGTAHSSPASDLGSHHPRSMQTQAVSATYFDTSACLVKDCRELTLATTAEAFIRRQVQRRRRRRRQGEAATFIGRALTQIRVVFDEGML